MAVKAAERKANVFVDDNLQHIKEDLYLIRKQAISFADNGFDLDSDELKFGNPRYFVQNGKMNAKGLLNDTPEMESLREAIRSQGLKHPPQLRAFKTPDGLKFEIVDGERRVRSILKLASDNVEVYNPSTQEYVLASEQYEWIQVRIEEMDDKTAISRAFSSNDRAVNIGEAATAVLVKKLRKCNLNDKEICDLTGRGIAWLRETDKIINLDNTTFQALISEKINRTLALKLSELDNEEERLEKLESLLDAAQIRLEKVQAKLSEAVEHAEDRAEMAEAEVIEADMRGVDSEKAERRKDKAEKRVKEIKEHKQELADKGPKANVKDWEGNKPLTSIKLKKHWVATLDSLLENDDDDSGTIDLADAKLLRLACDKIEQGEKDVIQFLRDYKNSKEEEDGWEEDEK